MPHSRYACDAWNPVKSLTIYACLLISTHGANTSLALSDWTASGSMLGMSKSFRPGVPMFQNFDAPADPVRGDRRLRALREEMMREGIDALIVPHGDEQRNEYLPAANERLAWLTGFTGSAGNAVVTADTAILFVDGRYTLQAAQQVDDVHIAIDDLITTPPPKWMIDNLKTGSRIGFDPWLHSRSEIKALEKVAAKIDGELVAVDNLVDRVWTDRPAQPNGKVAIHDFHHAGKLTSAKLADLREELAAKDADMCFLSDATGVSWLFNIRGSDVGHTPLVLAHALVPKSGDPVLFIDADKLPMDVRAFLTQVCTLADPATMTDTLREHFAGTRVLLDPAQTPHAIADMVRETDGTVVEGEDPTMLAKAVKNEAEIAGTRAAHYRDGLAMVRFLCWLDQQPIGSLDEIGAAKRLEQFRAEVDPDFPLKDISFDTISGTGPNGAIVHYRVNRDTNRALQDGELYLVDSGGQYEDGTTDITRTVAIGTVGDDERFAFTAVLRGHIALAMVRFPKGVRGMDLDVLARQHLWQQGRDYAHGTGHGVGSYLSVHEGPQNISRRGTRELLPGMIVSNEPGYYRSGAFGIRIENLVLVTEPQEIDGGDMPMLSFETLTLAPIDRRLIDATAMTQPELDWLNGYHRHVRDTLSGDLDDAVASWLAEATAPIGG